MTRQKWTDEEIEILKNLAGRYPFNLLLIKYNENINTLNKERSLFNFSLYCERSKCAIADKLRTLNISRRFQDKMGKNISGSYFSIQEIANHLAFGCSRVRYFVRSGKLPFTKMTNTINSTIVISKNDFKTFARKYPQLLKKANKRGLIYLLGSNLTDQVLHSGIRILDRDTGIIYDSFNEAADGSYFHVSSIRRLSQIPSSRFQLLEPTIPSCNVS